MPRHPVAIRAEAWLASLRLWAEQHRLVAGGVFVVGAVSFLASLVQLGPCFFKPESQRRLEAFLERNDVLQAQRVLKFDELARCYTAGWAVFIAEGTKPLLFVPNESRGPLLVKWSEVKVVLREPVAEVQFPPFLYDGPNSKIVSGEIQFRLPAVPGQKKQMKMAGVSMEVQTLLSEDYRTVFVVGVRAVDQEPASGCFR